VVQHVIVVIIQRQQQVQTVVVVVQQQHIHVVLGHIMMAMIVEQDVIHQHNDNKGKVKRIN
jgi:hypothetical protein